MISLRVLRGAAALSVFVLGSTETFAQARTSTRTKRDSIVADSISRAYVIAEARAVEQNLMAQRRQYLARASWAELGDRCNPGSLRVFANDVTPEQRDSLQALIQRMERTIIVWGAGVPLSAADSRSLLRTIVGWEAGIDRPTWDSDEKTPRIAIATGLTGEVPDPKGSGCLPSPVLGDTVTFVIPGFSSMEFPQAPKPRVKAYFGKDGQQHARDDFYTAIGRRDPTADLSYTVVGPLVVWRGWALVGVDRPKDRGGMEPRSGSNGGAVYMMRRVGSQWRLVSIVRSWGS